LTSQNDFCLSFPLYHHPVFLFSSIRECRRCILYGREMQTLECSLNFQLNSVKLLNECEGHVLCFSSSFEDDTHIFHCGNISHY
jgi:hypothetical protein